MANNLPHIGFIGTGVMGQGMVRNLQQAGYTVSLYTRSKQKAEELIAAGGTWCESIAELAAEADVVITMVGFPADVRDVYFGEAGILQNARAGTVVIDMTTSSPQLAQNIAKQAAERGLAALDAPVSGGDIGASDGTLTIMVGGNKETFAQVQPIFAAMGEQIVLQGEAGAGQYTKMSNQITIAGNMIGACEAIAFAEKAGLDPEKVLQSITSGSANSWSLSNLVPRMLRGDFAPGFYVKHFIKDMNIALESAAEMGLLTPGLKLVKSMYEQLAEQGEGDSGTQALIKWYRQDQ